MGFVTFFAEGRYTNKVINLVNYISYQFFQQTNRYFIINCPKPVAVTVADQLKIMNQVWAWAKEEEEEELTSSLGEPLSWIEEKKTYPPRNTQIPHSNESQMNRNSSPLRSATPVHTLNQTPVRSENNSFNSIKLNLSNFKIDKTNKFSAAINQTGSRQHLSLVTFLRHMAIWVGLSLWSRLVSRTDLAHRKALSCIAPGISADRSRIFNWIATAASSAWLGGGALTIGSTGSNRGCGGGGGGGWQCIWTISLFFGTGLLLPLYDFGLSMSWNKSKALLERERERKMWISGEKETGMLFRRNAK